MPFVSSVSKPYSLSFCVCLPDFKNGCFRPSLFVMRCSPPRALRFVDRARCLLDNTFTTLIGESYKRAYGSMVMVQQLAELEEIVQVKQ